MRVINLKAKGKGRFEITDESGSKPQVYDQSQASAASSVAAVGGMTIQQAEQLLALMDQSVAK
jgi:hypothetical protein